MSEKNLNRRDFLRGSFKYGAAAGIGTFAATKPTEGKAFFITAAKIYGELTGLACREPTLMAYEYASDYVSQFLGLANSGSMSTFGTGTEKLIQIKAEVNDNDVAREGESSPNLCGFQNLGFTQQRYMYRDSNILNTFSFNPPSSEFPLSDSKLNTKLLLEQNQRTRNLSAEERNELMAQFRSMGHEITGQSTYRGALYSDQFKASKEVRRILAFQALNTEAAKLAGDERYASQEQMKATFNNQEWRDELANRGASTGLMAELTRLTGQAIYNEHHLLLEEEKLLATETLRALDLYAELKKRR